MESTVRNPCRTFPKKPNGSANRHVFPRMASRFEDSDIHRKKKPRKMSKAKKRKKQAIFERKILEKKAAAARIVEENDTEEDGLVDEDQGDANFDEDSHDENVRVEDERIDCIDGEDENARVNDYVEDGENAENTSDEQDDDPTGDDAEAFREEIANMPMKKVMQLKEKLGIKLFNKAFFGMAATSTTATAKRTFSRENAKRPREMSSKRPVSKFRSVYSNVNVKPKRFDPRFDERCGQFDELIHRGNYSFVDDIRRDEKKLLKKEIAKTSRHDPEKSAQMKKTLRKICDREKSLAEADRRREVIRDVRRENNERLRQGKKPIFRTRADLRMRLMEKKFDELAQNHKLDKYMEKKARKRGRGRKATPTEL